MRSSRAARETTSKFFDSASSLPHRRSTRSSTRLARFAFNNGESSTTSDNTSIKTQDDDNKDIIGFGSDIEDAVITKASMSPPPSSSAAKKVITGKRKRTTTAAASSSRSTRTRTAAVKQEESDMVINPRSFDSDSDDNGAKPPIIKPDPDTKQPRAASSRRQPARKTIDPATGQRTKVEPPSDWEEVYRLVKEMRISGPAAHAAVDTMGCERLATREGTTPRERRFHTLVALMLSSQTKDTVNAEAMARLKAELPPHREGAEPGLTLENMLAVDPVVLNELIGKVGFHNNKTKYLKQAAVILRDQHDSDIPRTLEGLMSLPGVGPKMAHLCMGAEHGWDTVTGIGVDVHVHRITNLWGWQSPPSKTPEETRLALESWLPRDRWKEINWLLVGFGQKVCLPVGRRCGECTLGLRGLCKSAEKKKVLEARRRVKVEVEKKEEDGGGVVKRVEVEMEGVKIEEGEGRGSDGRDDVEIAIKRVKKEEDGDEEMKVVSIEQDELVETTRVVNEEVPIKKREEESGDGISSFVKAKTEDKDEKGGIRESVPVKKSDEEEQDSSLVKVKVKKEEDEEMS